MFGKVLEGYDLNLKNGTIMQVNRRPTGRLKLDFGEAGQVQTLSYQDYLNLLINEAGNGKYAYNKSPDVLPTGVVQEFLTPNGQGLW